MLQKSPAGGSGLAISVLDQAPISEGFSAADALRISVDLARLCDRLGFARYWVAEHHGTPMLACASPEALIGPIGEATQKIRVGSGGVMLPHYSPLKVAETFSMFAGLYPERIDLGLGRAPGSDQKTAYALQRDRRQPAPDDFPDQLVELLAFLEDRLPEDHPYKYLAALPGLPHAPEVYLLGSSLQSAIWAGQLGLPYVFADFINPAGAAIAERYRQEFVASERLREPKTIVAVWALAAETDEEAERLSSSHRMVMRLFLSGKLIPIPPVEEALKFLAEAPHQPAGLGGRQRRRISGSPLKVRREIEAVADEYGAEEAMIVTITHAHHDRRRSYELIAEIFNLAGAPAEPASAAVTPPIV
ncbi:MAG TPA: LLM class flavin-dependent oxidoreductase [Propylenella sp.]|nr:LLM class flavin-dependent oxidoreductase [Propylenella sp.]